MRSPLWMLLVCVLIRPAAAHDTWVQTNTSLVRVGDAVHIDLMLGNHGNEHRDFKLAGKVDPRKPDVSFSVVTPDGKSVDIKDKLVDLGMAPKEGYWSAAYTTAAAGTHIAAQTSDQVVSYAPKRSIKSAKAVFVASPSLDHPPASNPCFDRVLGHALEVVPLSNPVTPMGPGTPLEVKVLFKGHPLAEARVSFIPRGAELSPDFDERYERKTDAQGRASFEPAEGNYYLVVVHHETDEKGVGYESTSYSATLTVLVPAVCPCCGD